MNRKKIFLVLSLIFTILFSIEAVLAVTVEDNGPNNWMSENDAVSISTVNFTANLTTGTAPLDVLFTSNYTENPKEFNWTFGDGTYSNHNLTAIHTYTQPGEYNVSLTVLNVAGNETATKLGYITVSKTKDVKYVVGPLLNKESGASINGEKVIRVEDFEISLNQFLQWVHSSYLNKESE